MAFLFVWKQLEGICQILLLVAFVVEIFNKLRQREIGVIVYLFFWLWGSSSLLASLLKVVEAIVVDMWFFSGSEV